MIEAVTSKPPLAPSGGSPASNGDGSSGKRRRGPRKKKKGGKSGKAGGAAGAEPGAAAGGAGGEVAGNSPTKGASAAEKAAQPTVRDALEDLSARFLLNLPAGEETVSRVFSQVQQAHWFYEDHYADNYDHLVRHSFRYVSLRTPYPRYSIVIIAIVCVPVAVSCTAACTRSLSAECLSVNVFRSRLTLLPPLC